MCITTTPIRTESTSQETLQSICNVDRQLTGKINHVGGRLLRTVLSLPCVSSFLIDRVLTAIELLEFVEHRVGNAYLEGITGKLPMKLKPLNMRVGKYMVLSNSLVLS